MRGEVEKVLHSPSESYDDKYRHIFIVFPEQYILGLFKDRVK